MIKVIYKIFGKGKNESICHLEGKHDQDLINSLKIISKWIISTNNIQLQKKILKLITPALQILDFENNEQINEQTNTTTVSSQTLSLFSIQIIFKLYKIKINDSILTPEKCSQMGCNLARDLKKPMNDEKSIILNLQVRYNKIGA
ncbi:unnamed protein product [Rhizophagus irregularis]|nr:unnamed protein product [Rhizophagus irregularis]